MEHCPYPAPGIRRRPRGRAHRALATLAAVAALLGALLTAPAATAGPVDHPHRVVDGLAGTVSSYQGEVREKTPRADGEVHVDTPATIARLKALHVDTYLYLVWWTPSRWEDLVNEFAPAAQQAGIDVSVYLVPQSECCSEPYKTNFVAWGQAIGQLARQYPVVKSWVIDDVPYNQSTLTPEALAAARDAGRAENPQLKFYAISYYRFMSDAYLAKFTPSVDGYIVAYSDDPQKNTQATDSFVDQMRDLRTRLKPYGTQLVSMIYGSKLYNTAAPATPGYVRTLLGQSLDLMRDGTVDGTTVYGLQLDPEYRDPATQPYLFSHSGDGRLSLQTWRTAAHTSGSATTRIRVSGQTVGTLRFWVLNHLMFNITGNSDTAYLRVRIGDTILGQWDVTTLPATIKNVDNGAGSDWTQLSVDLSSLGLKRGDHADLTFETYDAKDSDSLVAVTCVDDISGTGVVLRDPGAEDPTKWVLSHNHPYLTPDVVVYDPLRPQNVFKVVQQLYAGRHW